MSFRGRVKDGNSRSAKPVSDQRKDLDNQVQITEKQKGAGQRTGGVEREGML